MTKILEIESCERCGYRAKFNDLCLHNDTLNREIDKDYYPAIPNWCPLEDKSISFQMTPNWIDRPDKEGYWWVSADGGKLFVVFIGEFTSIDKYLALYPNSRWLRIEQPEAPTN